MKETQAILLVVVIGLLVAGAIIWQLLRSQTMLDEWAKENDYQILESSYRIFLRGPFLWTTSRGQAVYYVKVRDADGVSHSGWVRCGGWLLGLLSRETEVRWDSKN